MVIYCKETSIKVESTLLVYLKPYIRAWEKYPRYNFPSSISWRFAKSYLHHERHPRSYNGCFVRLSKVRWPHSRTEKHLCSPPSFRLCGCLTWRTSYDVTYDWYRDSWKREKISRLPDGVTAHRRNEIELPEGVEKHLYLRWV